MSDIRTININLIGGNIVVENNVLGFQGEHNATTLSIVPPDEMTNCEDIVAYKVAFELNNCRHTRSELLEKTSPITIRLSSQITSSKEISVQVEGYSADGNLLVKSPKITKLTFADSVGGVSADYENEGGTASDIAANTLARHTHKNAEVLASLSENKSGNLTYNGKEIGNSSGGNSERETTEPIEFLNDYSLEANMDVSSCSTNNTLLIKAIADESNSYANKEIAKIEFSFDGGESWVDVRDFITIDPLIPYAINIFKSFTYNDETYDTICFGSLGYISSISSLEHIQTIQRGNQHGFRVTFYKD